MTAIAFPRDIPAELKLVGLSFPPSPMIEITPLRSGALIAKDLGPTLWKPSFRSTEMEAADAGVIRAWCASLLSTEPFYGYDKLREYPLAYPLPTGFTGLTVAGDAFSGKCALASVATNKVELGLSALPVGFILSPGDYIAFDYGSSNGRALHMVIVGGTADGSGALSIEVRPPLRVGYETEAATNGGFGSDTAWTKGTGWSIAAGVATAAAASSALSQAQSLVSGRFYRVLFTVSGFSGGTVTPSLGGTAGTARGADGTYSEIIQAAGVTFALTGAGFSGSIDNVSVLPAVHLYRPAAKMFIVPGSYSEQIVPPGNVTISFDAIQTL